MTAQESDGTAYCGAEDAESVTNEDADPPDDLFDESGSSYGDDGDDEDTAPWGPTGEPEV